MTRVTRVGQRPYNHQATGGQLRQPFAHQMAQAPLHTVTHDRVPHGSTHDETRTRRGSVVPRPVRVRSTAQMNDE